MKLNRTFCVVLAVLAFATIAVAAAPVAPPSAGSTSKFDDLPDSRNPIAYKSAEGQFSTTFPTGCARLHTRTNEPGADSPRSDIYVAFVTCERAGATGEGCLVNVRRGVAGGLTAKAASDSVMNEIRELLAGYSVVPARQTPLRRDFGKHGTVEGLDVQAHPQSGTGDVWIRGLLRGDDMYFLVAWKTAGGLFNDPEYALFFDAFRPWVE
jgi:hypothetical protein